jgi:UDP-N-acetylglucosamine--N-acetylmuramyl-(pentapeptide) pyrophosphoryl-undecaprenol N-acetylglucosamine transferase
MKIVITGAGGGHFYPLLAVIERVRKEVFIQKIVPPEVYFFSDKPYDERALFDLQIKFTQIPAGKLHLYPSLETLTGLFKTAYGIVVAFIKLYQLYPDVIFAKGGYASFPTLFAARMLSIPVIVHESDSVAGRTTSWAGKFAARVAVSYKEAAAFFPKSTVAYTGQPIRENLIPAEDFTRTYPAKERPVILVLGGSQGSQTINEALLPLLPNLLNKYDIVHQVGSLNKEDMKKVTDSLLRDHQFKEHYFMEGFIDVSLFYPKVDMVITRAEFVDESEIQETGKEDFERLILGDKKLIDRLPGERKKLVVLDIGSGIGRMTEMFAGEFGQVHGIDISPTMVEIARRRLGTLPNVSFKESEGDCVPYGDNTFDLIFSYLVFQHIDDIVTLERYMNEIRRTLKPKGVAKIQLRSGLGVRRWVWSYGVPFSQESAARLAEEAGLQVLNNEVEDTKFLWLIVRRP